MEKPSWENDYVDFFVARAPALRRTAYALCGDWERAEDLVQTVFVKLYVHWGRVRPETADAYARRALVNAFLSHTRKATREVVTDVEPPERGSSPPVDERIGSRVDLAAALARLTPRQRAIVTLRYVDDLSIGQIAHVLDLAEGTVKSHCARASAALRAYLSPQTTKG